jgi:hypothetical protein
VPPPHRYLLHDGDFAAKQSPPPPLLFYTGNEGDVESEPYTILTPYMLNTMHSFMYIIHNCIRT